MQFANVGFVGCGSHSTNNLYPMLKYARCRLQAVCDLDRALAERNARVFGARAVYTDVDAMLRSEKLDGVLVCGPPEMHVQAGRKVLERGIPLFVEKPPAPDLKSAEELVRLAKEHDTFVMTGFMKRHGLAYGKARELILAGKFQPAAGLISYAHWPCMELRGMLLGMSIHPIDLAISFFGDVAEAVALTHYGSRAISLALTLRFASGSLVQLMLDSSQPRIQERVEISGSMGGGSALIVIDNITRIELHRQGRNGIDLVTWDEKGMHVPDLFEIDPQFDLADIQVWRPDYGIPNMAQNSPFLQGYAGEIREFADAILEHREPWPGTDDTLKAMRVIEAVVAAPNGTTRF